jgi:hypothetical protein
MSRGTDKGRPDGARSVGLPTTAEAGIHIQREVAEAEGLPEDLDANVVGPYRFPDPRRRRVGGWIYAIVAAALAIPAVSVPLFWVGVGLLATLAAWHFSAGWPLGLEQEEALTRAAARVPFAVGHASAAITFHGVRARPRWSVVMYSADEPPTERALVEFDAVTGASVGEPFVEAVPKD